MSMSRATCPLFWAAALGAAQPCGVSLTTRGIAPAQDEVEGPVWGGVEGLAGVEGEDVVGPSPLELPLRHEQRGACVGAREGPLLPVADHSVPCEHFCDALGEGAVSSFMSSWPRAMGL